MRIWMLLCVFLLSGELARAEILNSSLIHTASGPMPVDEINLTALADKAREAFELEDYGTAIRLYTKVLGYAMDEERQQALEMLGVSRELNNQLAHAKNHYKAYLAEFPKTEGALRVQQRLAGLLAIQNPNRQKRKKAARRNPEDWQLNSYVSQFYQRHSLKVNGVSSVPINGLFSNINLMAVKNGKSLNNEFRVSASYLLDFTDRARLRNREYQVSSAYWSGYSKRYNTGIKLGRQSHRRTGVPGRFDGAVVSHQIKDNLGIDFSGGYLIDSSFNKPDSNRPFVGISGEYVSRSGNLTFEPFIMQQYLDGVLDRRAVGLQAGARSERGITNLLLDYDLHHSALNNVTLQGNYRFGEARISASIAHRKSPYLTTRNALIGQMLDDLTELEEALLDLQLSELAKDRTATSNTARLSITTNISEDWIVTADVTASSFSKTESSADVIGLEAHESIYSSLMVRTADIFGVGSYTALSLRRADSDYGSTTSLFLDNRINIGSSWRIYPRARLDLRKFDESGDTQWTLKPSLRLDFRHTNKLKFQAEIGYMWTSRNMINQDLDMSGLFIRAGYSARL